VKQDQNNKEVQNCMLLTYNMHSFQFIRIFWHWCSIWEWRTSR